MINGKSPKWTGLLLMAVTLVFCITGCTGQKAKDTVSVDGKLTYEDYQDAKVGVVTGGYAATFAKDLFPNAEILEFNSYADLSLALTRGKIDITPTLVPTMVGEVQAVIRDLAKQGLTMMIVTHEMNFARDVANRVFYMDEGGIYEDGTPEEIFEHPQKEKTIRFIRHIKVFERWIMSRNFDFIGFNTELEEFGRKNQISQKSIYRA